MPEAVVASGLVKAFGGLRAVDGLDLSIPVGSFYGIAGPNGAGKTTTLKSVLGLILFDSGTVRVLGMDPRRDRRRILRRTGAMLEGARGCPCACSCVASARPPRARDSCSAICCSRKASPAP